MAVRKNENAVRFNGWRKIDVIFKMNLAQAITEMRRIRDIPRVKLRLHCLSIDGKGQTAENAFRIGVFLGLRKHAIMIRIDHSDHCRRNHDAGNQAHGGMRLIQLQRKDCGLQVLIDAMCPRRHGAQQQDSRRERCRLQLHGFTSALP